MRFFQRKPKATPNLPLFDEPFLRRLERLNFHTVPSLRGNILGERRSRNLRASLDFSDHRPYSAGDDLRHVDWNAYARHELLVVKLSEATQSVDIHILLDRSPSMGSPPQNRGVVSKWDGARRLAGALSYLGLAGGERLHLTPFAQTLDKGFGPTHGKKQIISALQFLTSVTVQGSGVSGQGAGVISLSEYARRHPKGGLLVLISDLWDTVALEESPQISTAQRLAEGLRYLTPPRWQVLVVHLLTEAEVEPTFAGNFNLQDLETGEKLPFHFDQATLTQYRLRVRRWCAELHAACTQRGATYTRILAEWPLEQAVIPYLRQRGIVQ